MSWKLKIKYFEGAEEVIKIPSWWFLTVAYDYERDAAKMYAEACDLIKPDKVENLEIICGKRTQEILIFNGKLAPMFFDSYEKYCEFFGVDLGPYYKNFDGFIKGEGGCPIYGGYLCLYIRKDLQGQALGQALLIKDCDDTAIIREFDSVEQIKKEIKNLEELAPISLHDLTTGFGYFYF